MIHAISRVLTLRDLVPAVKPAHLLPKKESDVLPLQRKKFVHTVHSVQASVDPWYSGAPSTQHHCV
jgi:hypothetical protein